MTNVTLTIILQSGDANRRIKADGEKQQIETLLTILVLEILSFAQHRTFKVLPQK